MENTQWQVPNNHSQFPFCLKLRYLFLTYVKLKGKDIPIARYKKDDQRHMQTDNAITTALDRLALQDDDIARGLAAYGYPPSRSMPQSYESLAKIIIGQQISRAAATSIWDKLASAGWITAEIVASLNVSEMQTKGLSLRKSEYLMTLAQEIASGALSLEALGNITGDEVQDRLVALRGIGKWTADNYRLFALHDVDAWPGNDIALQEAMKRLKRLNQRPDMKQMDILAEAWIPYRGAGAHFLWHLYAIEVRNATPSSI